MRYFLGFDLDAEQKLAIDSWRERALPAYPNPVPAKNFHLTSVFLGQVQAQQLEQICTDIDTLTLKPFSLVLDTLGFWSKPKILFLGCLEESQAASQIATSLTEIAKRAHVPIHHRHYVPHLTLMRKVTENPPAAIIAPRFELRFRELHLFESVSAKSGVQYPIRFSWPMHSFGRPQNN